MNTEGNRLTLSGIFIATYTTLIFALPELLSVEETFLRSIAYSMFVIYGVLVDICFFLYVVFYALELSEIRELPFFNIETSEKEIVQVKNKFFSLGVYLIFLSFSTPVAYLPSLYLNQGYAFWLSMILYGTTYIISTAAVLILFRMMGKQPKGT